MLVLSQHSFKWDFWNDELIVLISLLLLLGFALFWGKTFEVLSWNLFIAYCKSQIVKFDKALKSNKKNGKADVRIFFFR